MSASSTAELTAAGESAGPTLSSGRSWFTLGVGLVLLLFAVLMVLSGQLVRLGNDRNHQPFLPAVLDRGAQASGELTLSNPGLLPIEVSLEPRLDSGQVPSSYPSQVTLSVRSVGDGSLLYQGPLKSSTGGLFVLERGHSMHLRVTVAADGVPADAPAVKLPYSYFWTARGALPWWWWIPASGAIALILLVGYWRPWRRREGAGAL